jgi:hypothetical protein
LASGSHGHRSILFLAPAGQYWKQLTHLGLGYIYSELDGLAAVQALEEAVAHWKGYIKV